MFIRCLAGLVLATAAPSAHAGAWSQPKGKGQVILKAEVLRASRGYDARGDVRPLLQDRTESALGLFSEYGLTDRLTVQFKGDWQSGEDALVGYNGRGPVELGLTWQAYRNSRTAVSVYGGYSVSGEGRNAGYAAPGAGSHDWEVRVAAGHSFGGAGRNSSAIFDRAFVEVQAARRARTGLPDETRIDLTMGGHLGQGWMVLGQAFGGVVDGNGPRWLSVETSVVRNVGRWSLQVGWREAISGRETPVTGGGVLAIWRRF